MPSGAKWAGKVACLAAASLLALLGTSYLVFHTDEPVDRTMGWVTVKSFKLPFKPGCVAPEEKPPAHRIAITKPSRLDDLFAGKGRRFPIAVSVAIESDRPGDIHIPPDSVQAHVDKIGSSKTSGMHVRSTLLKLSNYKDGVYEYEGTILSPAAGNYDLIAEVQYRTRMRGQNGSAQLDSTYEERRIRVAK